ncbi:MAG: hypothetical protein MJ110_02400 [Lachnospiraceae bacterium]|nr:hypothetical protein [Lachnospiraceae bacterium]
MNRFLILMPIWVGLIVFAILYFRKVESIPKIVAFVCAGVILGGVFSFVYADMSMHTSNYIGTSFDDIEGSDRVKQKKQEQAIKKNEKVQSKKGDWGSDFWAEYRKNK